MAQTLHTTNNTGCVRLPFPLQVEAPPQEEPQEPIPDVEWWDVRILADKNAMPQIAGARSGLFLAVACRMLFLEH